MAERDSEDFDGWYDAMLASASRDAMVGAELGLSPEVTSSGFLTASGLAGVVDRLRLGPTDVLVDLACGRGGLGIEAARRSGARLVGIDFSASALAAARQTAAVRLADRAEFLLSAFGHLALQDDSVDAVMCVDSIQFAEPPQAALADCRRVLRPSGRVVLTSWQRRPGSAAEQLPERIRSLDLDTDLRQAGFSDVDVATMDGWLEEERRCWSALAEHQVEEDGADAAVRDLVEKARSLVTLSTQMVRVVAVAVAP